MKSWKLRNEKDGSRDPYGGLLAVTAPLRAPRGSEPSERVHIEAEERQARLPTVTVCVSRSRGNARNRSFGERLLRCGAQISKWGKSTCPQEYCSRASLAKTDGQRWLRRENRASDRAPPACSSRAPEPQRLLHQMQTQRPGAVRLGSLS
ncbi:hypothetical protein CB1_000294031 [Camelus ferus]|nr:hypothetical protein CB1_000294031 [Camelus ferus]